MVFVQGVKQTENQRLKWGFLERFCLSFPKRPPRTPALGSLFICVGNMV